MRKRKSRQQCFLFTVMIIQFLMLVYFAHLTTQQNKARESLLENIGHLVKTEMADIDLFETDYSYSIRPNKSVKMNQTKVADRGTDSFYKILDAIVERVLKQYDRAGTGDEYVFLSNIFLTQNHVTSRDNTSIVTLSVHCSENNLSFLKTLAAFWTGPISLSVFTYDRKVIHTIKQLIKLHICDDNISNQVEFHLAIPLEHFPANIIIDLEKSGSSWVNCEPEVQSNFDTKNYADLNISYPSNVLRNLALRNVRSTYVINSDIDMLPSKHLYNQLVLFFNSNKLLAISNKKVAYVLPAFETNVTIDSDSNDRNVFNSAFTKTDLSMLWLDSMVRPFYWNVCEKCQQLTDYKRWVLLPFGDQLNAGYEVTWMYPWEPYYVTRTENTPTFNEKFKQYGLNRLSQLCEIHMAGFTFAVLDNGFVVHQGFKEKSTFHKTKIKENKDNLRLYRLFKIELKRRYPDTKRSCLVY